MSDQFDPLYEWLSIPPAEQPPHHYRLLGIELFESDADVIDTAAERQMSFVRKFQTGKRACHTQPLLNKLAAAKLCLLSPDTKATYDAVLQGRLAAESKLTAGRGGEQRLNPPPPPPPGSTRQGRGGESPIPGPAPPAGPFSAERPLTPPGGLGAGPKPEWPLAGPAVGGPPGIPGVGGVGGHQHDQQIPSPAESPASHPLSVPGAGRPQETPLGRPDREGAIPSPGGPITQPGRTGEQPGAGPSAMPGGFGVGGFAGGPGRPMGGPGMAVWPASGQTGRAAPGPPPSMPPPESPPKEDKSNTGLAGPSIRNTAEMAATRHGQRRQQNSQMMMLGVVGGLVGAALIIGLLVIASLGGGKDGSRPKKDPPAASADGDQQGGDTTQLIEQRGDGMVVLPAADRRGASGPLTYSAATASPATWRLRLHRPAVFNAEVEYAGDTNYSGRVALHVGGSTTSADLVSTGGSRAFRRTQVGKLVIRRSGEHTLELRVPAHAGGTLVIGAIYLTPTDMGRVRTAP